MVEQQARDLEVQDSNPGSGSNFSLEILYCPYSVRLVVFGGDPHTLLTKGQGMPLIVSVFFYVVRRNLKYLEFAINDINES